MVFSVNIDVDAIGKNKKCRAAFSTFYLLHFVVKKVLEFWGLFNESYPRVFQTITPACLCLGQFKLG